MHKDIIKNFQYFLTYKLNCKLTLEVHQTDEPWNSGSCSHCFRYRLRYFAHAFLVTT